MTQLEADVRQLLGKVAEDTARHRNLQLERDVAWDTYAGLSRKSEEARVASAVGAGNEVSVASESVVAAARPRQLGFLLPLAAITGALAGACLVAGRYYATGRNATDFLGPGGAGRSDEPGEPVTRAVVSPPH